MVMVKTIMQSKKSNQGVLKMNKVIREYEIGTEVVAKSKYIDVTCVGKIHAIIERNGVIYYAVCSNLFLAEELQ